MWRDKVELIADPNAVDPATAIVEADTREQIAKKISLAIKRLPPRQEMAVVLTQIQNLPYADAADRMGISVNTIKAHVRHAKRRLAKLLLGLKQELLD